MNSEQKLWHFKIKTPVDILIACDFVDKNFPDRVGKEPAQCWSWLDMTADFRFEYPDRPKNYSIVFDPKMKCWIISSNWNADWNHRFKELFGENVGYRSITNLAMNRKFEDSFDSFYEEKMEESKSECSLTSSALSLAERVAALELRAHDEELSAKKKRHAAYVMEEQRRRDNLFSPMLSCDPDY